MNTVLFAIILYVLLIALVAAVISFVVSFLLFRKKKFIFRRMMIAALSGECLGLLLLLVIAGLQKQSLVGTDVSDLVMGVPFYCMVAGVLAGIIWIYRDRTGYWQ